MIKLETVLFRCQFKHLYDVFFSVLVIPVEPFKVFCVLLVHKISGWNDMFVISPWHQFCRREEPVCVWSKVSNARSIRCFWCHQNAAWKRKLHKLCLKWNTSNYGIVRSNWTRQSMARRTTIDNVTPSGKDVFPSSRHESFQAAWVANRRDQSGRFTGLKSPRSAVGKRFYRFVILSQVVSSAVGMVKWMFGLSFASYIPPPLCFAILGS